jgi:hypothetical protein
VTSRPFRDLGSGRYPESGCVPALLSTTYQVHYHLSITGNSELDKIALDGTMIITVYPSATSSLSASLSLLRRRLALPTLVVFSTLAYVRKRQRDLLMAGLPKDISTQMLILDLGPYEGLAQASAMHRLG